METLTSNDIGALGAILAVWAHPDDETYLSGGLLAAATDARRPVTVVTATSGEAGFDDAERWPVERARWVRRWETSAAMAVLGVTDHRPLGYPDGGCDEADEAEAGRRLADIIDLVRPDTIVTFGPDGITGHADHRAVSRWVDLAVGEAASCPVVLHAARERAAAERFRSLYARFPIILDPSVVHPVETEDLAFKLRLDGRALDRKLVALRAQATQTTSVIEVFGEEVYRDWVFEEAFVLAPVSSRAAADADELRSFLR